MFFGVGDEGLICELCKQTDGGLSKENVRLKLINLCQKIKYNII